MKLVYYVRKKGAKSDTRDIKLVLCSSVIHLFDSNCHKNNKIVKNIITI